MKFFRFLYSKIKKYSWGIKLFSWIIPSMIIFAVGSFTEYWILLTIGLGNLVLILFYLFGGFEAVTNWYKGVKEDYEKYQ